MNLKKITAIIFLILLLLIPFVYSANGDYKIPEATKYIEVMDDGSCVITEEILYDIEGTVNGVYRDIPLDSRQEITDVSVETPGYYNNYTVTRGYGDSEEEVNNDSSITGNVRIKVWLYNDKEHTQKINDQKVPVIFKYTFNKGLKIYNDVVDFQYMSWGDEWASKVDTLKTYIKIPGSSSETEFWNNPTTHVTSSKWENDNELVTTLKDIPEKTTFEQRILMPTSYFKSTKNAKVINRDAKELIEEDQKKYVDEQNFKNLLSNLVYAFMALLVAVPLAIFALFGREPKIDYNAEYEYDLPTDATPLEVNAIFMGDVGKIDAGAFKAVILDLIDRGIFKIISANSEDTILKITITSTKGLKDYEADVVNYLAKFRDENGEISMASISDREDSTVYQVFMSEWKEKAQKAIPDSLIERYFDDKGVRLYKKYLIVLFISIFVLGAYGFFYGDMIVFGAMIVVCIVLGFIAFIPNTVQGRWTPEGRECHEKWLNFKKYLTDYSLINEKPPESVQVWGKYIVYAAAMDCANSASYTMQQYFNKLNVSDDYVNDSNLAYFAYNDGFSHINTSFNSLQRSSSESSSSDSIGSSGSGGFGGGGGGTF